jgi:trimeric autotransporter adhesin
MWKTSVVGAERKAGARGPLAICVLAVICGLLIAALAAHPAGAASTFVVNRTSNEPDANLGDTPNACDVDTATAGNQCTLRAAIQEANATANEAGVPDEIRFNIPGDTRKVKTIKPTSELPIIGDNIDNTNDQAVIIDGYTQPGSTKNTKALGALNAVPKVQLNGSEAGPDADGLIIGGNSNVTIRGLVINEFDRAGIFVTSTGGSDNNTIEGNFIGTNAAGTADRGNGSDGVQINGLNDGNVVGMNPAESLPEQRNLISGNDGDGVFAGTSGTDTIKGNLIGTDKSATLDIHNGTQNNGEGVNLGGQNSVVSNNIIAFNTSDGVQVRSNNTGVGHDIGPNSIFSNDGLGIDIVNNANNGLGPNGDGPNTNDGGTADDADTGPNDLQNFPTITFASTSTSTGETSIDAFLDTVPSTQFLIRFYSNPNDTGEGKTFLGDTTVTTDSSGTVAVNDFVANRTVPVGQSITATATKVSAPRNTSEFSGEPRSVRSVP